MSEFDGAIPPVEHLNAYAAMARRLILDDAPVRVVWANFRDHVQLEWLEMWRYEFLRRRERAALKQQLAARWEEACEQGEDENG